MMSVHHHWKRSMSRLLSRSCALIVEIGCWLWNRSVVRRLGSQIMLILMLGENWDWPDMMVDTLRIQIHTHHSIGSEGLFHPACEYWDLPGMMVGSLKIQIHTCHSIGSGGLFNPAQTWGGLMVTLHAMNAQWFWNAGDKPPAWIASWEK